MQRANCTLRLSGDLGNTVRKLNVSVAEIAVLRSIHGVSSVVDVSPTTNDKTPHAREKRRLAKIYGDERIEKTFPGAFPTLPKTFGDIGLVVDRKTGNVSAVDADDGDDGDEDEAEAEDKKSAAA